MNGLKRLFHSMLDVQPRTWVLCALCVQWIILLNVPLAESVTIFALAFIQNAGYSLQSRAANRTSNLYHFIAAIFATAIFFVTLSLLVHIKVTLDVLLVYILGTMLGSVYGTRLSVRIEQVIGAVANLGAEAKGQVLPLYRAIPGLLVILAAEFFFIGKYDVWAMVFIALAAFASSVLFASLRIARNTDAYWFHLALVFVHAVAGFVTYGVLVKVNGDWYLFAPYLTGSVLGSLVGAEAGKRFGRFIRASFDAHDLRQDVVPLPSKQVIACLLFLVPQVLYFGFGNVAVQALMLGAALLQTSAMTLISRARQRNHERYIEWSSVFSNGIWFFTLNVLVVNELAAHLLIPYLVGTGIGSLWGQAIAMFVERRIGAFMDSGTKNST